MTLKVNTALIITLLTMASIFFNLAEAKRQTLCLSEQMTFFSCSANNKKLISLCGTENSQTGTLIDYRFGKPGHIEFIYPQQPDSHNGQFSYVQHFRYQFQHTGIGFTNNHFRYYLYHIYDGSVSAPYRAGVLVTDINKHEEYNIECKKIFINKLGNVLELILPNPDGGFD